MSKSSSTILIIGIFLILAIIVVIIYNSFLSDQSSIMLEQSEELNKEGKFTGEGPIYIINITAYANEKDAIEKVKQLKSIGYKSGYLWIPDYPSLSGKKLFVTFLGPYYTQKSCEYAVEIFRKSQPDAYGVLISNEKKRIEIWGVDNIKIIDNRNH